MIWGGHLGVLPVQDDIEGPAEEVGIGTFHDTGQHLLFLFCFGTKPAEEDLIGFLE